MQWASDSILPPNRSVLSRLVKTPFFHENTIFPILIDDSGEHYNLEKINNKKTTTHSHVLFYLIFFTHLYQADQQVDPWDLFINRAMTILRNAWLLWFRGLIGQSGPARMIFVYLCWGFTAQSTQWGHVERSQFT